MRNHMPIRRNHAGTFAMEVTAEPASKFKSRASHSQRSVVLPLRRIALFGAVATIMGFFLVFLPIFQDPSLWSIPSTEPAPAYELFGLLLFAAGSVILLYSLAVFTWRRRSMEQARIKSLSVYKIAYKPAVAGFFAFWVMRAVTRIVLPAPPSNIPLSPLLDVGTLFLGAIVALAVAYYLVRYYDKIPFTNPLLKSVILSALALFILGAITTLTNGGTAVDFLLYLPYEAATFIVTGLVVGLAYIRIHGADGPPILETHSVTGKRMRLYYLAILAVVVLFVALGFIQGYYGTNEPVSFTASNIRFQTSNGTIDVLANVTNTSSPSIIQVNAALDGLDLGVCGYGIDSNHTMACNFLEKPLLSCGQVPQVESHTLTLSAYFGSGRTLTNSYAITRTQLGCN